MTPITCSVARVLTVCACVKGRAGGKEIQIDRICPSFAEALAVGVAISFYEILPFAEAYVLVEG